MKLRQIAVLCFGLAVLGTVATLLYAKAPQPAHKNAAKPERDKLRGDVVRLQTEVELLRFDYELHREMVLEELKMVRGMNMMGGFMSFAAQFNSAVDNAGAENPGQAQPDESKLDAKTAAEEAKAAEEQQRQQASFLAEQKKELSRRFTLLVEKRLDLDDAERKYRELPR